MALLVEAADVADGSFPLPLVLLGSSCGVRTASRRLRGTGFEAAADDDASTDSRVTVAPPPPPPPPPPHRDELDASGAGARGSASRSWVAAGVVLAAGGGVGGGAAVASCCSSPGGCSGSRRLAGERFELAPRAARLPSPAGTDTDTGAGAGAGAGACAAGAGRSCVPNRCHSTRLRSRREYNESREGNGCVSLMARQYHHTAENRSRRYLCTRTTATQLQHLETPRCSKKSQLTRTQPTQHNHSATTNNCGTGRGHNPPQHPATPHPIKHAR